MHSDEDQTVEIHVHDLNTDFDFTGTNLNGNACADWTTAVAGDVVVCTKPGTNWYCRISKSV